MWFGRLTLQGVDPRRWDLNQLMAAYEVTLQQGAKDESEWQRTRSQLYAEPPEVKRERLAAGRAAGPARVGMSLASVEALLGQVAARDAEFGSA